MRTDGFEVMNRDRDMERMYKETKWQLCINREEKGQEMNKRPKKEAQETVDTCWSDGI
jgi:hypothetical protein